MLPCFDTLRKTCSASSHNYGAGIIFQGNRLCAAHVPSVFTNYRARAYHPEKESSLASRSEGASLAGEESAIVIANISSRFACGLRDPNPIFQILRSAPFELRSPVRPSYAPSPLTLVGVLQGTIV